MIIEPQNIVIKQEWIRIKSEIDKSNQKDKEMFGKFLASSEPKYEEVKKPDRKLNTEKINEMITENAMAVKLYEKMKKTKRAEKCKKNIEKLEKMKEDVANGKEIPDMNAINKDIKEMALKQGYVNESV